MAAKYVYTTCIGSFALSESFAIIESRLVTAREDILKLHDAIQKGIESTTATPLKKKHNAIPLTEPDAEQLAKITDAIIEGGHLADIRSANIIITRRAVKQSVKDDQLIIQAIKSIEDLEKITNNLTKRLREWYAHYNPEGEQAIDDNERFCRVILEKPKEALLKETKTFAEQSMGADLKSKDVEQIKSLALHIVSLYDLRLQTEAYIESLMKGLCPNLLHLAGPLIGAKLLAHAGSLEQLCEFPASTVQLLGAEKALFRHLRTRAKPPKYGVLINHPLVTAAPKDKKGKAARVLADKIAIAVKVDYFKGDFIADKLEKKIKSQLKQGPASKPRPL